jgi:hypothetical protein
MKYVVLALGLATAALGVVGIGWPESLAEILRRFQSPAGLYIGAVSRIALGGSLLLCARRSRTPDTLRVLGVVFLVAGLVMPFVGLAFFEAAIDSFLSMGRGASAVWGVVAIGLGLFVAYAVTPPRRAD